MRTMEGGWTNANLAMFDKYKVYYYFNNIQLF